MQRLLLYGLFAWSACCVSAQYLPPPVWPEPAGSEAAARGGGGTFASDPEPGWFAFERGETGWAAPAPIAVDAGGPPDNGAQTASPAPAGKRPAISFLDRSFVGRLLPHEAVYFIYGPDAPAAKFQLSFKYRLVDFVRGRDAGTSPALQFGYTQRSLWDTDAPSSPFYDTSYMPELMYESFAPARKPAGASFAWLGYQAAFKHESNGRDDGASRGLNTVYFRPYFAFGDLEGWRLLVVPEVFAYVGGLKNNPLLEDYRGYGKLNIGIGRAGGVGLNASLWAGKDLDHKSVQLDLTIPLREDWMSFEAYLLVQYFNGHGESLRDYRGKSEAIRIGISLVR